MKKFLPSVLVFSIGLLLFVFWDSIFDIKSNDYVNASNLLNEKSNCIQCPEYIKLSAKDKISRIWNNIEATKLKKPYPANYPTNFEELILLVQSLNSVFDQFNDMIPAKRRKMVHSIGSTAKIRYVSHISEKNKYTGIYKLGSLNGLIRLSLALNPKTSGNFAPGFGMKFLIDGQHSENLIGMFEVKGNGYNYDFFAVQLKTKVGGEPKIGFVDTLLKKAFENAENPADILGVDAPSVYDETGKVYEDPKHPAMLYLVPTQVMRDRKFQNTEHDFRLDLDMIEPGTDIYDVYGTDVECLCGIDPCKDILSNLDHCKAEKIGTVKTDSHFVASDFGDNSLFFQHSRWRKKTRLTCTYANPLDGTLRDSTVLPLDPNSDCQSAARCGVWLSNPVVSSKVGCPFDAYLKTADTDYNVPILIVEGHSIFTIIGIVFILLAIISCCCTGSSKVKRD